MVCIMLQRMNFNTPLGVPVFGTPKKYWIGAAIGAAGSIIGGLLSNSQQAGYTKEQQKLQSRLNREEMNHSMGLQQNYQEWLNNTQYGAGVAGMKNAGLNPAMAGGSGSGAPSSGSVGKPSTGGVGPAFHGEGLAGAMAQGAMAGKEVEMMDSQKDLMDAQAAKLRADTNKTNQDILIDEWKTDPRIQQLFKDGLDAEVMKTYADADVSKARVIEVTNNANKIFEEIGLVKEQKAKCQAETARTYTEILSIFKGMDEADSRMALNYAMTDLAKEQKNTEKAKQFDLYASGNEHKQNVEESKQRVNESKQRVNESKARTAGIKIANRVRQWQQKVVEASGSVTEQGAIMGAKRIIGLFNPLDHFQFGQGQVYGD